MLFNLRTPSRGARSDPGPNASFPQRLGYDGLIGNVAAIRLKTVTVGVVEPSVAVGVVLFVSKEMSIAFRKIKFANSNY